MEKLVGDALTSPRYASELNQFIDRLRTYYTDFYFGKPVNVPFTEFLAQALSADAGKQWAHNVSVAAPCAYERFR